MTTSLSNPPAPIDLPALRQWCLTLHAQRLATQTRSCLWISGNTLPQARALALCDVWPDTPQPPLWLGAGAELTASHAMSLRALPMAKAATQLGGEQSLVIFDAQTGGLDPDAFGAVAGTLKAGGLLVLLTSDEWALQEPSPQPDDDYARLAHWPVPREQLSTRYLARLARRLQRDDSVLHWRESEPLPDLPRALPSSSRACRSDASRVLPPHHDALDPACLTQDQSHVVAALASLAPEAPLVISADRGRGKSAALGIAAARCLLAGESVWLTAPRPAAVAATFARLGELLPQGQREGNVFRLPGHHSQAEKVEGRSAAGSELRFLAPDAIEAAHLACHDEVLPRLFVDEAAAIPTPLLKGYLAHFPRIAFATTVHGYEGTGRGFQLRFCLHLDRVAPDWRALEMNAPVRWAPGDPLEALTNDLLLLSAQPAALPASGMADPHQWLGDSEIVVLERDVLARDEPALNQLFGLLVQAHYRTTPADLRQLLDTPGLTLLAIRQRSGGMQGDTWWGVVAAVEEGGFPAPLARDIWTGQRRPRGHLLAQSLAAHAGHQAAAQARWWRILRIAVHPALWRHGQGTRLLKALEQQALAAGVTRLGTSFGAEVGLVDFWQAQGFLPLRMGLKRDAASGEHAVMMGKTLRENDRTDGATGTSCAQDTLLVALHRDFQRLLPSLLRHELSALPPALADRLGANQDVSRLPRMTPSECARRLDWYQRGGGGLALVRPWLQAVLEEEGARQLGNVSREGLLLAMAGQDTPAFVSWAQQHGIQGRKARERWCREAVGCLSDVDPGH